MYPSRHDTETAKRELSDALAAIHRARYSLRVDAFARDALDEAEKRIYHAKQAAAIADDYWNGRLADKPA